MKLSWVTRCVKFGGAGRIAFSRRVRRGIILGEHNSQESIIYVISVVLAEAFCEKAFKNLWEAPKMVTSIAAHLAGLLQCSPYPG